MSQRNVPKIEWATPLAIAAPALTPVTQPLPDETPLEGVLSPLDAAPLTKAGIVTVGGIRNAGDLTSIKGIGAGRAMKILDAIARGQAATLTRHDLEFASTLQPMLNAFKALDTALEISKTLMVLSTGYPRVVTVAGRSYIVIRWGMYVRYQYFFASLVNADPRFHACPPLSNQDTGMIECYEPVNLVCEKPLATIKFQP